MDEVWLEDYLSTVTTCGYKYMDFMRQAEAESLPGLEQDRIAAIRESLERNGLTPTTEASLHHTTTRCHLGHGVDFAVQEVCRQIDMMAAVGVRYYLSCGTPDEMLYETLFTVLREAAAYGQDKGVTMTIESHATR
jgi:sugar phosphate isomerase/epimerase